MSSSLSPMMIQWHDCKKKAKDALLFFRLGDFYEGFYEDAEVMAKELTLTLTKRNEVPMCGVPFFSVQNHIDKLVAKGYAVAIAEQMEEVSASKGLVKREITQILTPGTLISSSLIHEKQSRYLAALCPVGDIWGLALLDHTTGEFLTLEVEGHQLEDELMRLKPKEILLTKKTEQLFGHLKQEIGCSLTIREASYFDPRSASDLLLKHFNVHSLDGFGLQGKLSATLAAGSLLLYLMHDLHHSLTHITTIKQIKRGEHMELGATAMRHLEILDPLQEGAKDSTLLSVLDHTQTPMGARMLRSWLAAPLLRVEEIQMRQDRISTFLRKSDQMTALSSLLRHVGDLPRLLMRMLLNHGSPRDMLNIGLSLAKTREIQNLVEESLPDLTSLATHLLRAIVETPPLRLSDGGTIQKGYNQELDKLLEMKEESHSWIATYQTKLREETGIKALKVGYTRAFGYYIEVARASAHRMPSSFIRKQTLVNAERYICPELKDFEHKILTADARILGLEEMLFIELKEKICMHAQEIRLLSEIIASIDALLSLAIAAKQQKYVRPHIDCEDRIAIQEGRHPTLECILQKGSFIPNDVLLDAANRLHLITGPNMAGKSTFMRQVALIVLMAQIGSFVPAMSAKIGIVDKIFTRIGASDNLARGQSTFMVEMAETASILNNATSRSLVILDEIGRGTSTYDGISLARAIAEALLLNPALRPKTLFATHYFELTELEGKVPGAINSTVSITEEGSEIIFLHKIVKGRADRSYGIHVAKLAGLPHAITSRAEAILSELEKPTVKRASSKDPILKEIQSINLNTLNPLEALLHIDLWQKKLS